MIVHSVFALIHGNVVRSVTVGEFTPCNDIAKHLYGENSFAVDVTQYPVQPGDLYDAGTFTRDGVVIERVPTDTEEIQALRAEYAQMRSELDVIGLAVLDLVPQEV